MEEDRVSPRRLVRLRVDGLLGRFEHDIHFPPDWRFLIVHGPNGVGKTRLLELVYSAFSNSFGRLARIPFSSAQFDFDDGRKIGVERRHSPRQDELPLDQTPVRTDEAEGPKSLKWTISTPNDEPMEHTTTLKFGADEYRRLRRILSDYPYEQVEPDLWLDVRTHETLDTYDAAERVGLNLPSGTSSEDLPTEFQEILHSHEVHLIATQRLLNTTQPTGPMRRRSEPSQQPTVVAYANDLRHHLNATLAANSRISQQLDRSFPKRLFEAYLKPDTDDILLERYEEQLQLRSRLAAISILDSSPDLPLPERDLVDWHLKVLQIYLDDVDEKLAAFMPLLTRLELFTQIINKKFLFKKIKIDRERGFAFYNNDSNIRVSSEHLSSGEQHEVILMYELMMKVNEQSLVLIDEPEISLHVAWQKAFLDDLDRVASLRDLRFIIATHSPQIIGDWWDRTVELYSAN